MATELLRVTLPMPPSTNNLYRNGRKGRVVTDEYEAWRWEAYLAISEWPDLSRYAAVPWEATIAVYGLRRGADLDNRAKATLDILTSLTGLKDDYCDVLIMFRAVEGEPRVAVIVTLAESE